MSIKRPSRRLALAAALAAVTLTAAACSSSSSGSGSGGTTPAKHYTIAFVPGATGVSFYDTVLHGMQAKAKALGMTVTYQGSPDFAPSAQTPIVDGVCSKHPSVLVVAPTDPVAMAPAINTCLNEGIPVITVDTQLSNTSRLTAEITTDNTEGGKLAGAYLGKALHSTGQIAELSLSPTATTQVDRLQAVDSVLKSSYPGIKVATLQYTQQATSSSETTVRSILSAHPQVKAIFGVAEPNAEGAISAIAAAGAGRQGPRGRLGRQPGRGRAAEEGHARRDGRAAGRPGGGDGRPVRLRQADKEDQRDHVPPEPARRAAHLGERQPGKQVLLPAVTAVTCGGRAAPARPPHVAWPG